MKYLIFVFIFFCFYLFAKPPAIIMVGPPGSGKGTQSQLIEKKFLYKHISTGDLLRDHIKNQTALGKQVSSYMAEGKLVPDELILNILWERIRLKDCSNGFIIDGSSRNLNQAKELFAHLNEEYNLIVIILKVNDNSILERLKHRLNCENCHMVYHSVTSPPLNADKCDICKQNLFVRKDDREDVIISRLSIYNDEFIKLKNFYQNKNNVFYVNGDQRVDEVFQTIRSLLATLTPIAKAPSLSTL